MARCKTRLSQVAAAKLLGVTQPCISTWIRAGFSLDWSDEEMHAFAENRRLSPDNRNPHKPVELTVEQRTAGLTYSETRTEKLKREIEHLELKIQREKGELVFAASVRETGVRIASIWCSELDAMVSDLPGQVAGLNEAEVQPKLKARIELLKAKIRAQMEAL